MGNAPSGSPLKRGAHHSRAQVSFSTPVMEDGGRSLTSRFAVQPLSVDFSAAAADSSSSSSDTDEEVRELVAGVSTPPKTPLQRKQWSFYTDNDVERRADEHKSDDAKEDEEKEDRGGTVDDDNAMTTAAAGDWAVALEALNKPCTCGAASLAGDDSTGVCGVGVLRQPWRSHPLTAGLDIRGLPRALRPKAWFLLSGAARLRASCGAGFYDRLMRRVASDENPVVAAEIDRDIKRTFPERARDERFEQRLRRVLYAYALFKPAIGYCQGANFIAGTLLAGVYCEEEEEETAFWVFVRLVHTRRAYYCRSMVGCLLMSRALADFVRFFEPALFAHIEHHISVADFLSAWLLTLWTDCLPTERALHLWDVYVFYGEEVMFWLVLALLRQVSRHIMDIQTPEVLLELLLQRLSSMIHTRRVVADALALLAARDITAVVESLRELHMRQLIADARRPIAPSMLRKVRQKTLLEDAEIEKMWEAFLGDSWAILVEGEISDLAQFQRAIVEAVLDDRDGRLTVNGLLSGVSSRLFSLFRAQSNRSEADGERGGLDFFGFVAGVEALTHSSRARRMQLCYRYFADDQSNVVSAAALVHGVGQFRSLHYGARANDPYPETFKDVVYEKVLQAREETRLALGKDDVSALKPEAPLSYDEFSSMIALEPLVAGFFDLPAS